MTIRRIGDSSPAADWRSGSIVPPVRTERAAGGRRPSDGEPTPVRGVRVVRFDGYLLFFNEDGDVAELSRAALAASRG